MATYIVDNQKLDMSDNEWVLYQKIVASYTNQYQRGQDLFIDLFQSDDNGIIVFLKPPSKRHTSLEIFLFLVALQQQQHLRVMYALVQDACDQMREKIEETLSKPKQTKQTKKKDV
jgi:hypothetical protein